jgi:hypothetical protein
MAVIILLGSLVSVIALPLWRYLILAVGRFLVWPS